MNSAAKPEDKAKPESTANGQGQGQNSEDMGTAVEGKQEPMTEGAAKPEVKANSESPTNGQGQGQHSEEKGAAVEDNKHAQEMLEEEHQALNRQKQLEDQANATEMELLKDALIDSIISKPHNNYEEEELIF